MRIIVVGGGKIGYPLSRILKEKDYQVTLIEQDKATCNKIVEASNIHVIWGDGTDIKVLKEAGIKESQIIITVTGKDEENLVICQMVKLNSTIKTIAYMNNPKNKALFKNLGIDTILCGAESIVNLIEEIPTSNL